VHPDFEGSWSSATAIPLERPARLKDQPFLHSRTSGPIAKKNSRSCRNLPPHRPKKIFDREQVAELRRQGLSYRQIAKKLALGLGIVTRTVQARSKSSETAIWNKVSSIT